MAALAATVVVLLSACQGVSAAPPGGPWITADQAAAEFRDEAATLELAPGWTWPDATYDEKDGDLPLRYGVNTGRVDAAWYWHCSWARTYFAASSDDERDKALAEVLKLRESAFYEWGLESEDRAIRDAVLDDAAGGNTERLRVIIDVNCPAGP